MIRFVWLMLLGLHTGVAAVWWWIMPGGFPSSTSQYWVNQIAPPLLAGALATALLARGKFSEAILPPILAIIPVFWLAFGVSARIVFPDSFGSLWYLPFFGGAACAGLWAKQFQFRVPRLWLVGLVGVAAAIAGWSLPGSLRAPDPATAPAGGPLAAAPAPTDHKLIKLTKNVQVHPADGLVVTRLGELVLNVQPMMSFADRSPDRGWTDLAPDRASVPTVRTFIAKTHDAAGYHLFYKDQDENRSVLDVSAHDELVQLDARTQLKRPIFSHVNSFAEVTLQGRHPMAVAFSPAPSKRIEITAGDAPARFAYLDGDGTFHVVQASHGQLGPFTDLASGPLKKGDPLVLTIYDGDKAAFTVTFADFAAQASTQLSPTAGWDVPVNAIELVGGTQFGMSRAILTFTLASTTIGRSTQTVGHAAGIYRDRVTIARTPASVATTR